MEFPVVMWGRTQATFLEVGTDLPAGTPVKAALVFALSERKFVLADIAGRGWCIPGGRLEAGETPEQAARREVWEEIGATVGPLLFMGHYLMTETDTGAAQLVPTYVAAVETLASLPSGTESKGVRTVSLEDLPSCYFTWDALMESVFRLAFEWSPSPQAGRAGEGSTAYER
jgi:8-oxo-dGTP diphosphatase